MLALAACTPRGGEWEHDALTLSPTPVVLRPPFLLNPGKVASDLCLGLADTVWRARSLEEAARPDSTGGVRFADGRFVRIHAQVHTADGERWEHAAGTLSHARDGRPAEWCFHATARDRPEPRYRTVELSASAPVQVTYVRWKAAAFGSL